MAERLLSIQEVSKALGVHAETLRHWDTKGKLVPVRTPGGHRRYRQSDIDTFMGTGEDSKDVPLRGPAPLVQERKPDNRVTIRCSEELAREILAVMTKVVEGKAGK